MRSLICNSLDCLSCEHGMSASLCFTLTVTLVLFHVSCSRSICVYTTSNALFERQHGEQVLLVCRLSSRIPGIPLENSGSMKRRPEELFSQFFFILQIGSSQFCKHDGHHSVPFATFRLLMLTPGAASGFTWCERLPLVQPHAAGWKLPFQNFHFHSKWLGFFLSAFPGSCPQ